MIFDGGSFQESCGARYRLNMTWQAWSWCHNSLIRFLGMQNTIHWVTLPVGTFSQKNRNTCILKENFTGFLTNHTGCNVLTSWAFVSFSHIASSSSAPISSMEISLEGFDGTSGWDMMIRQYFNGGDADVTMLTIRASAGAVWGAANPLGVLDSSDLVSSSSKELFNVVFLNSSDIWGLRDSVGKQCVYDFYYIINILEMGILYNYYCPFSIGNFFHNFLKKSSNLNKYQG